MVSTIADRVRESADRRFVGRRRELEELSAATRAQEAPFLVAFVHGPGGIGKTSLVRRVLSELPPSVRGLYLDGRDVEPTPEGFCRAIGHALGLPEMQTTVATIARALGETRVTLVVDTYEMLGLLDAWLRTRFLPTLPATTVTILAGRDRPASGWYASAGWPGLVAEFPLGCLSAEEAAALLRSRGLDVAQAAWANGFARGHPLALELAAAAVRADASCTRGEPVAPAGLLESFLGQLPAATVKVVEAAAMVRRVTEPILAALLDDAGNGFGVLRALPFVEEAGDGLLLHNVVREHGQPRPVDARSGPSPGVPAPCGALPHRPWADRSVGPLAAHRGSDVPDRESRPPRCLFSQLAAEPLGGAGESARSGGHSRDRGSARAASGGGDTGTVVGSSSWVVLCGQRLRRVGRGLRPDHGTGRSRPRAEGE